MEGIFFSRRTVGSFFVTHATEGAAYITSAHDNIADVGPNNFLDLTGNTIKPWMRKATSRST